MAWAHAVAAVVEQHWQRESGNSEEQKRVASRRFFGRASFDEIVWKSYPSPNVPRSHVAVRCSDAVST
jgi:hypothetical protein